MSVFQEYHSVYYFIGKYRCYKSSARLNVVPLANVKVMLTIRGGTQGQGGIRGGTQGQGGIRGGTQRQGGIRGGTQRQGGIRGGTQ